MTKRQILIFSISLLAGTIVAQETERKLNYDYPQKVMPQGIDNYLFSTYFFSGKKTYNMRGAQMSSSGEVKQLCMNPAGSSFAVIEEKGGQANVLIYDLWKTNKQLCRLNCQGSKPLAICYSPNARLLAVALANHRIILFDTRDNQAMQRIETSAEMSQMAISNNNYYLAAVSGQQLYIWNLHTNQLRMEERAKTLITDVSFTPDNSSLGVLTADGVLTTYDTQSFKPKQTYDALGEARGFFYHQDGKYAAVVTGDGRIAIINFLDLHDRDYIDNADGGITDLRFLKDSKLESYLAYNTRHSIVYTFMNKLSPYYTRLVADELNERMTVWLKRQPDETLEQYNLRVNDQTRAEQILLFEREIVTRMADDLLDRTLVTLGSYNPSQHMLSMNFDTMPTIYLDVPESDVNAFADPGVLEFRNAVYGLTEEDHFELIYADVYNKQNDKTYVFDNLDRRSLAYLENDDNFVPLEIIQQSNAEEMVLKEIKESIIDLAKKNKKITDNTEITVSATAENAFDADGRRITNYNISFAYQIDQRHSTKEDFALGRYHIEESAAAMSMLAIVKQAFTKEMAAYIVPGKQLVVTITGMADAVPISRSIAYDGSYGEYDNEPVRKDGNLVPMSISKATGITSNEQLAFLRALGVDRYVRENISALEQMDCEYNYNIDLAKQTGGQYRRISIVFTFIDAFKK